MSSWREQRPWGRYAACPEQRPAGAWTLPTLDRMRTPLLHETLREWAIKFGPLFAADLRHQEPRRGSRWLLEEVCTTVDGIRHWLWRAVDEHGFVLDILLQRHRDTEAAKTFLISLLEEYDVPEVIHTDQLRSYGEAIREIPSLVNVDHQHVISTARCNNMIEQRAGVVYGVRSAQDDPTVPHGNKSEAGKRPHAVKRGQRLSACGALFWTSGVASPGALFTPRKHRAALTKTGAVLPKKSAGIQTAETRSGIPKPARPSDQPPPSFPNQRLRINQKTTSKACVSDVVCGCSRGSLNFRLSLPSAYRDAN